MLSAYQHAAKLKWPGYSIVGDGQFAVACPITNRAELFDSYMVAMTRIALDHSNWRCKDDHQLEELKPAPVQQRRAFRFPGNWEKD